MPVSQNDIPEAEIQRTILQILTQTTKQEVKQLPDLQHIRILAMNETGRAM